MNTEQTSKNIFMYNEKFLQKQWYFESLRTFNGLSKIKCAKTFIQPDYKIKNNKFTEKKMKKLLNSIKKISYIQVKNDS